MRISSFNSITILWSGLAFVSACSSKDQEKQVHIREENRKIAEDFLFENEMSRAVVSIHDGMVQYVVLTKGHPPVVHENTTPLIRYQGMLIDGTIFDGTVKGEPLQIQIKHTLPGFKIGILGMNEGEKRRIFIHPDLGYGISGPLPSNSLLIFDVEVVAVNSKEMSTSSYEKNRHGRILPSSALSREPF